MGILWNYLLGYVIIEIKGAGLERFINQAVLNGVELWNVKRTGADSISAYTATSGFFALRKLVRGRGIKIAILNKRGLPARLNALRFRKVLLYGWAVALALIIAASRFIWVVQVEGCDRIDEATMHQLLDAMGIAAGTPRAGLDLPSVGTNIMRQDDRIAWAGAELEGVVLTLTVYEADEQQEDESGGDAPSSVYAAHDGLIISVTPGMGVAAVKAGDVVKKGQLLISGDLSTAEREGPYVSARGEVTARTVYVFSSEAGPYADELVSTGEYADITQVSLPGISMDNESEAIGEHSYELIKKRLVRNLFIPMYVEHTRRHTLTQRRARLSYDRLEDLAMRMAGERMLAELPKDGTMIEKKSLYERLEGGAVRAVIIVTIQEDIGETGAIYAGDRRETGTYDGQPDD